jgi:hypothetical protein
MVCAPTVVAAECEGAHGLDVVHVPARVTRANLAKGVVEVLWGGVTPGGWPLAITGSFAGMDRGDPSFCCRLELLHAVLCLAKVLPPYNALPTLILKP